MKKLIMYSIDSRHKEPWVEDYLIDDDVDGLEHAQGLIEYYNSTLRPGDVVRELVRIEEENLSSIVTTTEFYEEVGHFRRWVQKNRMHSEVSSEQVGKVFESMVDGDGKGCLRRCPVSGMKSIIKKSGCSKYTKRFDRLIDSPICDLRWDDEEEADTRPMEEMGEDKQIESPFDNIHPVGIVEGGVSIGVYADPMSFGSAQLQDFENLESDIEEGMGKTPYYITRIDHPGRALKERFDLVVVDYGGMTIPGMSGSEGFQAKTIVNLLEETSSIVWLASTFTVQSYDNLIEGEFGVEHPNLMTGDISKEEDWHHCLQKLVIKGKEL